MSNEPIKQQIYRFVCYRVKVTNGRFPTHREIMAGVGLTTTSVVGPYLESLAEDGLLIHYRIGDRRHYAVAGQQIKLPLIAEYAAQKWEVSL